MTVAWTNNGDNSEVYNKKIMSRSEIYIEKIIYNLYIYSLYRKQSGTTGNELTRRR